MTDEIINPIDKANELIQKMKEENDRTERLLKQKEEILAKEILSGRSNGGSTTKQINPEEERINKVNETFRNFGIKI